MYQGTTPKLIFKLMDTTLDLNSLVEVWVTLKLSPYNKTFDISRCSIDNANKTISIELSQEETLEMPASKVESQIRGLLGNGKAFATNIVKVDVNRILKGGVIE